MYHHVVVLEGSSETQVSSFLTSHSGSVLLVLTSPRKQMQGTKIFQYCTCPVGRVTYNLHSSYKYNVMHLSFKSVCNKEHKGVICNTTSSSYSSESTRPTLPQVILPKALVLQNECFGKNYSSFLDFTRSYEPTSGIFVPCNVLDTHCMQCCLHREMSGIS